MPSLHDAARQAIQSLQTAEAKMADPVVLGDSKRLKEASQAYSHAKEVAEAAEAYISQERALVDAKEAAASDDPEMKAMGEAELAVLTVQFATTTETLELLLVPPDPYDAKDVMVEIRAGAGGEEAALFAGDLFRMYARYAERQNWKASIVSESRNELGGYKEVIFIITGTGVYGCFF